MNSLLENRNWASLSNPPIIEAVIQFDFENDSENWIERLLSMHEEIKSEFPNKDEEKSTKFSLDSGNPDISETTTSGLIFRGVNGSTSLFTSQKTFAFVRSNNYSNWEDFTASTLAYWKILNSHLPISSISRRSARFINRIMLPMPLIDIKDWLNTYLVINPESSKELQSYSVNYSHLIEDSNILVNVMHTMGNPKTDRLPFFIDIDIIDSNIVNGTQNEIESALEQFRTIKNNVFFLGLTEKTINLLRL